MVRVRAALRFTQILMTDDLTKLAPDWGIVRANIEAYPATAFATPADAQATRTALLASFDAVFAKVRNSDYSGAKADLPALRAALVAAIVPASATNAVSALDAAIGLVNKGANLPPA